MKIHPQGKKLLNVDGQTEMDRHNDINNGFQNLLTLLKWAENLQN